LFNRLTAASGKGSFPGNGMFNIDVLYVKSDFDLFSISYPLFLDPLGFLCAN